MSASLGRSAALRVLAWLLAPGLLFGVLALLAMLWRTDTEVRLELLVGRVAFTVAGDGGDTRLLDAGKAVALRADRVAGVAFAADALAQADPARFDPRQGGFPADAWTPLGIQSPLLLGAGGGGAGVSLEPDDPDRPMAVQGVWAGAGAQAVLSVGVEEGGERPWLTLRLEAPSSRAELVVDGGYRLFADGMVLSGAVDGTAADGSLFLRANTRQPGLVRLTGATPGLVLQLEPFAAQTRLLGAAGIPVAALDFSRQEPTGARVSSLSGPGRLSWPGLPGRPAVELAAGDGVGLSELEQARLGGLGIRRIATDAGAGAGLALVLDGRVAGGRVGRPGRTHALRLSLFERLRYDPLWGKLLAVLVFGVSLGIGGYRLWRELRTG